MSIKATASAVEMAADEIASAGATPTIDAIVERVGGSKGTVGPLLKAWQSRQPGTLPPVPVALAAKANALAYAAWAEAITRAGLQVHAAQQEAASAIESKTVAVTAAIEKIAELEDRIKALLDELATERARSTGAQAELISAQHRASESAVRLEGYETKVRQHIELEAENRILREQIQSLNAALMARAAVNVQRRRDHAQTKLAVEPEKKPT